MTAPEALLAPTITASLTLRPKTRPRPPCRPLTAPSTMEARSRFHWPRGTRDNPTAPTRHRTATARDAAGHDHPTPDPRADCHHLPGPWDPTTGGAEMPSRSGLHLLLPLLATASAKIGVRNGRVLRRGHWNAGTKKSTWEHHVLIRLFLCICSIYKQKRLNAGYHDGQNGMSCVASRLLSHDSL